MDNSSTVDCVELERAKVGDMVLITNPMYKQPKSYILYDERAILEGTDEATILVTCKSDDEARSYAGNYGAMCCYSYTPSIGGLLLTENWEWNWSENEGFSDS